MERGFAGFPLVEADDRAVRDIPFFDDWVLHADRDAFSKIVLDEPGCEDNIRAIVQAVALKPVNVLVIGSKHNACRVRGAW